MTKSESLQLAAQAWCDPTCETKIMDGVLAAAFAKILRREVIKAKNRGRMAKYDQA